MKVVTYKNIYSIIMKLKDGHSKFTPSTLDKKLKLKKVIEEAILRSNKGIALFLQIKQNNPIDKLGQII
ncbi:MULTISPECIES: hypothetical protein [Caldicellulosiruptor]|uniref:hypothetical protein n=1 Tax=Caldicellulosiruptor TaxID=44000 RepID=UPI00039A8C3A|nr:MULTISPECIES: hypothetical protein [Caldicellulosiruptor]